MRHSVIKGNSAGLFITTAGNDLVHTLSINRSGVYRSAIVRKIMAYNNTGANVTLRIGTRDMSAAPLFVAYLPTLLVLNGTDNEWLPDELPAVEFSRVVRATVNGREGNIYAITSAAGVLLSLEVEEYGN